MSTFALSLNSVPMHVEGAWTVTRSLSRLLGHATRGRNRVLPGVPGAAVRPKIRDELAVSLDLRVRGLNDHTGAPHADPIDGKVANLIYLRTNVAVPISVTAVLTHAGGSLTAAAQVANWQIMADEATVATVAFDLIVPSGQFA
jgi:hypothetical protein